MIYFVKESDEYTKAFNKIEKKDKLLADRINKKLKEIINNPEHYKPLRNVLKGKFRIQFGSYVLKYIIDGETIYLDSIDPHDQAY